MNQGQFKDLHTNQRLLLEELVRRGAQVEVLIRELELVEARCGEHVEFLLDRDSSACPYPATVMCSDKYLTKKLLLRAGLPVPAGELFNPSQKRDALNYCTSRAFPLVVKPCSGSHGIGCFTDLESRADVEAAIDLLVAEFGQKAGFLIEEQRPGMEFRVFVTRNGDAAVLHRDPAAVFGDGLSTIRELAEAESFRRTNPRTNCLCPIVLDRVVETFLARAGMNLESVPAAGVKVYLRRNSNLALGGTCEDYTGRAHRSVFELAKRALAAIRSLPYAGIDILSADIEQEQTGRCCILEVNSNPGIHMHMRPARGEPQNVAAYLADVIFPETRRTGVNHDTAN